MKYTIATALALASVGFAAPAVEKRATSDSVATYTLYAPFPSEQVSGYYESDSIISTFSNGNVLYQAVESFAPDVEGDPAETLTATILAGPSTLSYYQSDASDGAAYQICSGASGSASCQIVEEAYSVTSGFVGDFGPYTTITAAPVPAATATK